MPGGIAARAFAGKDDDLNAALQAYLGGLASPACFDEAGFREYLDFVFLGYSGGCGGVVHMGWCKCSFGASPGSARMLD